MVEVMEFERPEYLGGWEAAHPRMATPGTLRTMLLLGLPGSSAGAEDAGTRGKASE